MRISSAFHGPRRFGDRRSLFRRSAALQAGFRKPLLASGLRGRISFGSTAAAGGIAGGEVVVHLLGTEGAAAAGELEVMEEFEIRIQTVVTGGGAGITDRSGDGVDGKTLAIRGGGSGLPLHGARRRWQAGLGKWKWGDETAVVAALIRKQTGVRNRWVAERLGMGHEGNVTRALRRVNKYPAWKSKLLSLEAMLVSRNRPEWH